jgi:hypothetical protein
MNAEGLMEIVIAPEAGQNAGDHLD